MIFSCRYHSGVQTLIEQLVFKSLGPSHSKSVSFQAARGTVFLFTPHTEKAEQWIAENVVGEATYFGGALVVEHRYARDLAVGMIGIAQRDFAKRFERGKLSFIGDVLQV